MRRLNVKLALWLVGVTLFLMVGVHFLHAYQLDRNAEVLRDLAEKAEKAGDVKEAIKQYNQFLKYRDDEQGYSSLAKLVVGAAQESGATNPEKWRAFNILQEAIRRHPNLADVRRQLVDYTMMMRRSNDALDHIQYLEVENGIKDPALDVKAAQCYLELGEEAKATKKLSEIVGLDQATGTFKPEPGPGSKEVLAFEVLAQILRRKGDDSKADDLMAQLVAYNPDMAKARLGYASYLASTYGPNKSQEEQAERFKKAKEELDRAAELDPEDADVLLASSAYARNERDFPKAQELFERALAKYPQRQEVYVRLAQLAGAQNETARAVEYLEKGVKAASDTHAIMPMLLEFQFQTNDLDAVRKSCETMRQMGFPLELIRYSEARLKFAENDVWGAAREFEVVRPALSRSVNVAYLQQLDILLGRCYQVMAQPDRELEVYRRLVQAYPALVGARLGQASALQTLGMYEKADPDLDLMVANAASLPFLQTTLLQMLVNSQLQKPEDARKWTDVDKVAELIFSTAGRTELDNDLLKAEVLIAENELSEAQTLLLKSQRQAPKDVRVWTTLAKLLLRDPTKVSRLPQLLTQAEKQAGDVVPLRLERLRLILREGGEKAGSALADLEKDLQKFSEGEQIAILLQLGSAYAQIRDYPNAKRAWKSVIEKDRLNAQIRQALFELAVENNDKEGADEAMQGIRDLPQLGSQSPLYKYCAAVSLVRPLQVNRQSKAPSAEDRKTIAEARKLIEEATLIRGEWSVLWRVRGEIDQLENNLEGAIADYQRAIDCNRNGASVIARRLVQLLYTARRFSEANDALKLVGEISATDPLHKVAEHIGFELGNVDAALASAKKDAEENPKNAAAWIWYGQLLSQALRSEEAEEAFRKSVSAGTEMPQAWDYLVRQLINNKKTAEAVEAVRQAGEHLGKVPLAMAALYQEVGDASQAEHYFKLAIEEKPDDLAVRQRTIEFLLASNQADKAIPYLEEMIAKTGKAEGDVNWRYLTWARRTRAAIMAAPGDYDHVTQAIKLVEQNAKDGQFLPADIQAMVDMLSPRSEPASRAKALQLLEQLQQQRPLTPAEQLVLGRLYERSGKWNQGKDMMIAAISRQTNSPDLMAAYSQMLIQHGEYDEAGRWLDRLDELLSKLTGRTADNFKRVSRELRATVFVKTGQPEQAVQVLESLVPSPLAPNQLGLLVEVSRQLENLELYEAAEKMLNQYISLEPRGTIAMAAYLGRRGEVDKSFAMLEEARKAQPAAELLPCALETLRRYPQHATKERYKMLEDWGKSGLQVEADSQQVKLLLAELYDLEGRYAEVMNLYREVLTNKNATPLQQAIVKNNLAFLLAVTKQRPESGSEALTLINDAIKVMGPTSDLLDTRALAYMAQGDAKKAITDLKSATADAPSATKYFHLAQAEKQDNNLPAAKAALDQAQQAGVDLTRFTPLEQKTFSQLVDELK